MSMLILIVDDEAPARFGMAKALRKIEGVDVREAEDGESGCAEFERLLPGLVFLDLTMPGMGGLEALDRMRRTGHDCEIVVVTANEGVESAVVSMRQGATDYLTKPYEVERIRSIARRNLERVALSGKVDRLQARLDEKTACGALVGVGLAMQELFGRLRRAARAPLDVLVHGETGTGKELIARELHRESGRTGPFVAVNTAAIQDSLAESELFGHTSGAFTGAVGARAGVFEQADGGTLFLDEIGDMPLGLQAKMLRVLQERTVRRVGGVKDIPVDVRVISATHQDLTAAIEAGQFREDLLYRLRGIELFVPPLRERQEDIVVLAQHFLDGYDCPRGGTPRLSTEAKSSLVTHLWPGNVRELQQVITAGAAMCEAGEIGVVDLDLRASRPSAARQGMPEVEGLPLTEAKNVIVRWFEREQITAALRRSDGNVSAAARSLGMHRQSLQQKMGVLGIEKA